VLAARLNDGELAAKVERMDAATKQLQKDTEKAAKANKTIDKPTRESLKNAILQIQEKAKEVRTRLKDDRPASVEVGQLFSATASVKETVAKLSIANAAAPALSVIDSGNEALARAFELKTP